MLIIVPNMYDMLASYLSHQCGWSLSQTARSQDIFIQAVMFQPHNRVINLQTNTISLQSIPLQNSCLLCSGYSCRLPPPLKHVVNKTVATILLTADIWQSCKQSKVWDIGQILCRLWTNTSNNIGQILWGYRNMMSANKSVATNLDSHLTTMDASRGFG